MKDSGLGPWAKINDAMGLLENLGKALVKQAFRDPAADVTCWAKKTMPFREPETQGKRCKNQWYLHGLHHFSAEQAGPLGACVQGHWDYWKTFKIVGKINRICVGHHRIHARA